MTDEFFAKQLEQSRVKTAIVSKYFNAWASVMKGAVKRRGKKMAYLDLFCGPGHYEHGEESTPLIVLRECIRDPDLRSMIVTHFNDRDQTCVESLERAIAALPGVKTLKYYPRVHSDEVGSKLAQFFEGVNFGPTLFFVDPFGYKGLSLRLIGSIIKNWGCDAIVFFNYLRINPAISNKVLQSNMIDLFGEETLVDLRTKLDNTVNPVDREATIIDVISESFQSAGAKFILPFRFNKRDQDRCSHHLIFLSKHPLGYGIMKDIMAGQSSGDEQGVPTFEFNPAVRNQGILFELSRPLDDLSEMLKNEFAGQTLTRKQIYEQHNIGRRFTSKNYRTVLLQLEADGNITTVPVAKDRRKGTLSDKVSVTFPNKGN